MDNMKTKIYKNDEKGIPARKSFSPGALTAPLPPALVTVGDEEDANVLTVAWTGILATVPPKTYISVRPSRHSHALLKRTGEFVLHLPSADMAKAVDYAGIFTGAKVNKFEKCGFEIIGFYSDFDFTFVKENDERWYVVAKAKK